MAISWTKGKQKLLTYRISKKAIKQRKNTNLYMVLIELGGKSMLGTSFEQPGNTGKRFLCRNVFA